MMTLSVSALGDTHPGRVREVNEDDFYFARPGENVESQRVAQQGYLYVAADGVGGNRGGDYASKLAVERIPRYYYQSSNGNVTANLQQAVQAAGRDILAEARRNPERSNMSCTVVAAAIHGNQVTVAHLGDARAYLLRQGRLLPLTRDHTWVQEQVDAQTLTEEEARNHEYRNVITKSLGSPEQQPPAVNTYPLHDGDRLLLCTDGLCGVVDDIAIGTVLSRQAHIKRAVEELIQLANSKGGPDNIAVVVAQVGKTRLAGAKSSLPAAYALLGILAVGLFIIFALSSRSAADSPRLISTASDQISQVATTVAPNDGSGAAVPPTSTRSTNSESPVDQPPYSGPAEDVSVTGSAIPPKKVSATPSPTAKATPQATPTLAVTTPPTATVEPPNLISPLCDENPNYFPIGSFLVLEWKWSGEWQDGYLWKIHIFEPKSPESDVNLVDYSDTTGEGALKEDAKNEWKFSMLLDETSFHEGQNITNYQWEVALVSEGTALAVSSTECFMIVGASSPPPSDPPGNPIPPDPPG